MTEMPRKGLGTHGAELSLVANLAVNSLKIKSLQIEQRRDNKKILQPIRPEIHAYIQAPKSSFKSTVLKAIAAQQGTGVLTDLSFAGLVGSIDKDTRQVVPAAAWDFRNKVLLFDEWAETFERKVTINALLQFTEGGYYSRKIARASAPVHLKDKKLYFRADNGMFEIQTRVSVVMATMHNLLRSTARETQALISRCIPYEFKLSDAEIDAVLEGQPLVELSCLKPKETEVVIPSETYRKILDLCKGRRSTAYPRMVGDVCRAWALVGWDTEIFDFLISCALHADVEFAQAMAQLALKMRGLKETGGE